jgi:hypothetical protein
VLPRQVTASKPVPSKITLRKDNGKWSCWQSTTTSSSAVTRTATRSTWPSSGQAPAGSTSRPLTGPTARPTCVCWRGPKSSDLSAHSADDLDWVAAELNDRPRKHLGFKKPIEQIGPLLLR